MFDIWRHSERLRVFHFLNKNYSCSYIAECANIAEFANIADFFGKRLSAILGFPLYLFFKILYVLVYSLLGKDYNIKFFINDCFSRKTYLSTKKNFWQKSFCIFYCKTNCSSQFLYCIKNLNQLLINLLKCPLEKIKIDF